jgi:hypothetical protein
MTHPGKYAPPGWVDPGPFEREAQRLTEALVHLTHELADLRQHRAETPRNKRHEYNAAIRRNEQLQKAHRLSVRRNDAALRRAYEMSERSLL